MKKKDFIKAIADETGLTQQKVNEVLDEVGKLIVVSCRDNGDEVALSNIGTFKQKVNPTRKGRNPMTGETIQIKASKTIQFRPTSSVKVEG